MDSMKAQQVMSGTEGEVWIDGDYMAEVKAFKAEIELTAEEVAMVKTRGTPEKVTGFKGKGTLKLNKVSSYMIQKMADNIKNGKQTVCKIISKLDDPDSIGSERIAVEDATFKKLTLADWEAKKLGEESIDFTFSDFSILDSAG